jgi:hypothetical protein
VNEYSPAILFAPQIERVKVALRAGVRPSEIANSLHAEGIGAVPLIAIFHEATGAPLGDLKAFGQWWSHEGVTDARAFDDWAAEVLRALSLGTGGRR